MLARSHFLRDRPGDEEIAVQEYRKTIDLVEKGHMDNLGLGNYSLGELGRIALKHDRFGEAVALYARQVAGGSQHAIDSLWWVTQKIPNDTAVLEREIGDPLFQKFLIAYALSRADGTCSDKESRSCGEPYTSALSEQRAPQTAAIVEALGQLDPRNVQWPDQAAALAYSVGNFAVASRLLKVADSPYAEWIRAKMALHAGDLDDAAQAFARASKNFASSAQAAEAMPLNLVARLRGEHSVLLLSRGDYIEALYQLSITHHFRDDALYVAERVLTLDELKSLVDKEVWADSYRDLLARRLARANRFDEAMQYYRDRAVSLVAAKYVEARHQAVSGSTPLARAQGWYQVAQLEITSGMELLGTERCPDYSEYEGNYGSACDEMAEITGELTIPDEVDRVKSSAAAPDARFHYRSVAVAHLLQAAELLPKRSKLMSAVLCNGVAWLQRHNRSLNEDLIQAVYRRYRQDGRAEPWTQNFGATCVEPDFAH
jgi:tetratricopeptide (TPR) repeat protein